MERVEAGSAPRVAVIMGSKSDWQVLRQASDTLSELGVRHENRVLSAHRTPDALSDYVSGAQVRGVRVFIAGAGGAAHLAGVIAAKTTLPVLGVPMQSAALNGIDSLLSTVQMPAGIPVGTLAIGEAGAVNAGLFAVAILALSDPALEERLQEYRARKAATVLAQSVEE